MYINRTDRAVIREDSARRRTGRRTDSGENFGDTIASIVEGDVVEISDENKRNARQEQQQSSEEQPHSRNSAAESSPSANATPTAIEVVNVPAYSPHGVGKQTGVPGGPVVGPDSASPPQPMQSLVDVKV